MNILVVDDEQTFAKTLATLLKSAGHSVRIAENGEQGWTLYQEQPCSIVLSDWNMPVKDGLSLCRSIRRFDHDQYCYFMLITGNSAREKYLEAMDAGVDDFLRKPLDKVDLMNRLRVADRILTSTARIKKLESLLPICSYCKRIREKQSNWLPLEEYMNKHADAEFSHGICPSCLKERVPPLPGE